MKSVMSRSALGRRVAAAAVVGLAATSLSLGLATSASAATVDLEGTVTGVGGVAVEGYTVYAYNAGTGSFLESTTTDAAGKYQLSNLSTDVKVYVEDNHSFTVSSPIPYAPRWLGGVGSFAKSPTVHVTADPGAPFVAPTVSLSEKFGVITGTATADGRPIGDANLSVSFTADDVDDEDMSWNFATDGSTYRMLVLPGTIRAGLEGFDTTTDPANPVYFVRKWWQDTYSQAKAKPIVVGSGQTVSGINFALTKTLAATESPQILGIPKIGGVLTAAPGTWSQMGTTQFTYAWLRGATVVGTGPSYVPTVADFGSRLSLQVTADADKYLRYHNSGQVTVSTSDVVRYGADARGTAKALAGHKVRFAVKIVSAKQSPVRGKVVVLRGSKVVHKAVKLVRGKAVILVKGQPKGKQTYTVLYKGSSLLSKATKNFTVRVR